MVLYRILVISSTWRLQLSSSKPGHIKGIRFSTSPGLISERLIEYLKPYPVNFIELGVQSFDDTVLEKSNRDHNTSDVYKATHLLNSNGIKFGIT